MGIITNRRRVMGVCDISPIPNEYFLLAGIHSLGGYVQTNANANLGYLYHIEFTANNANNWIMGSVSSAGSPNDFGVNVTTIRFSTAYVNNINLKDNNIHTVELSSDGYGIDGNWVNWANKPTSITATAFRLLGAVGSSLASSSTVFRFWALDKNTQKKVIDYYPCQRKADGVLGYYNLINNVFYTVTGNAEAIFL